MRIPRHRVIIIIYICILGSAVLTISLFLEGRNYPATGWTILTLVFIFFAVFEKCLTQKEIKRKDCEDKLAKNRLNAQRQYLENFEVLLSSKDPIKVYAIKDILSDYNIKCVVLDNDSSQMFGFLPDVKMRVVVHSEDFDESVKIVESIKELKVP